MSQLNRKLVEKTIRGYAIANRITEAERQMHLKDITIAESLQVFQRLYESWKVSGQLAGGNLDRITLLCTEDAVSLRQKFMEAYRRTSPR